MAKQGGGDGGGGGNGRGACDIQHLTDAKQNILVRMNGCIMTLLEQSSYIRTNYQ